MYPLLKIPIDCRYINMTIKVKNRFFTGQVLLSNKSTSYFKGESIEGNFETNTFNFTLF